MGEIVGVNKEFIVLIGWIKDVLLGKELNCNINFGGIGVWIILWFKSFNESSVENGGVVSGLRLVFFVELMDYESVVEFYEDYL